MPTDLYMRGVKSENLLAIIDFLYCGEADVYQENPDSFLAIAEELKLKGLTGQTSNDLAKDQEHPQNPKPVYKTKEVFVKPTAPILSRMNWIKTFIL